MSDSLKLVVLGGKGSGKSALVTQFTKFYTGDGEYDPTTDDSHTVKCNIDGEPVQLDVLDTAGQEEYSALREQYMRTGQGFLHVYSITNGESFKEIEKLNSSVQAVKDRNPVPIVLVAYHEIETANRQVSEQDGRELAQALGCPYFEVNAKSSTREAVEAPFFELARLIRQQPPSSIIIHQRRTECSLI